MTNENCKIKRFIDCLVPVNTCNLRCHYCYVTQARKFSDKLPAFKYTAVQIGQALSRERLGGTCCINFCGAGETLLPPEMTEIIVQLLKQGHYIMVVTNGTVSKRFDELLALPSEFLSRLMFKFSFQYLELKRKRLLGVFFDNLKRARNFGCSFSLELTPTDELIPELADVREICMREAGAPCHVTMARNNTHKELPLLTRYSLSEYASIWAQFDSELFAYKLSVFNQKRYEFCYAGDWTVYLNLGSGELRQCYKGRVLQNVFKNPTEPIRFMPIGSHCPEPYCYNAHAWLTFGAIPEHFAPTYAAMRNRRCGDGSEWLTPDMKAFLSAKLAESNHELERHQKDAIDRQNAANGSPATVVNSIKKHASILLRKIRKPDNG